MQGKGVPGRGHNKCEGPEIHLRKEQSGWGNEDQPQRDHSDLEIGEQ